MNFRSLAPNQIVIRCIVFIVACVLVGTPPSAEAKPLSTDKEKASYAIGQQIGRGLKTQGVDVDIEVLVGSLNDAFAGKPPAITPEEMRTAMQGMQKAAMEQKKKEAEANKAKGEEFLKANKAKPGVKETASGLQYKVIKEGTGANPKPTDKVKVHYKGTLIDGTKFDSSYDRNQPAEFGLNQVIKGWGEGIPTMKVGGKTEFYIPSDLAYGPGGRPSIPGNSVLVFEVELLDILTK